MDFFCIIICIPILYTSLEIDDYYDFFDIKFISKEQQKERNFYSRIYKLNRIWRSILFFFFFIMLLVVRIKLSCQRMAIVYFCFIQLILDNSFLIWRKKKLLKDVLINWSNYGFTWAIKIKLMIVSLIVIFLYVSRVRFFLDV